MKKIYLSILESDHLKELFKGFFDVIQASLEIKEKGETNNLNFTGWFSDWFSEDITFKTLLDNQNNIQFKHFAFFINSIRSLEKNQNYSDSIEWKILQLLSSINIENPIPTIEAIEYLDKAGFLQEDRFSVISMASVIYCLSNLEPVSAAKMLVRLNALNLLTEQNIGKINAMDQAKSTFLPKIIHKLNLVEENKTNHLLNQANLNKLLKNSKLNLEILAQFIQVEDKFKILDEKKFDLAMILNQLLTQENIEKIEKTAFDPTKLIKVLSLLDQNQLLNQENFDRLLGLNKTDFEEIIPVLNSMHENLILNQENMASFLDTFLAARIYDALNDKIDSAIDQNSYKIKTSFIDKLCKFLSKVKSNAQVFFDEVIKKYNKIMGRVIKDESSKDDHSLQSTSSFFTAIVSSQQKEFCADENSNSLKR